MAYFLFILCVITTQLLHCIKSQTYSTCAEWMTSYERYALTNGVFSITSSTLASTLDLYCVFDYENNYAWTLIESATKSWFRDNVYTGFPVDYEVDTDDVDTYRASSWGYRLSKDWMQHLQDNSNYLYATCEFDTTFTQDWLLFDLNSMEFDILTDTTYDSCTTVISANILGTTCVDSGSEW